MFTEAEWDPGLQDTDCGSPISRLSLYPQMATDPIHGHPPWALVLVAVSVGESSGKAGPICEWGATFQP